MHPSSSPRRRGFTLIELLTVIAIIGILAAIIIPVVGRVRQSAKTATSTSNLRQIGMAANVYASETKFYPDGIRPNWAGTWDGLLAPYVAAANSQWGGWGGANTEVFVDPARGIIPPPSNSGDPVVTITYSANPNVFVDRGNNPPPALIRPEAVKRPSQTVLVGAAVQKADSYAPELFRAVGEVYDSNPANGDIPIFTEVREDGTESSSGWQRGYPSYRHGGRTLMVMGDASVKAFRPGELTRKNFCPYY